MIKTNHLVKLSSIEVSSNMKNHLIIRRVVLYGKVKPSHQNHNSLKLVITTKLHMNALKCKSVMMMWGIWVWRVCMMY